jgi:bacteriophage HK97-gp10 putative tail-component
MAAFGKVEGEDAVLKNLNREIAGIEGRTLAGLLEAGLLIERESKPLVPVDTGNLRGSGYTRKSGELEVEVGYSAAYAVFVHEDLEAHHKVGQAKFLEQAVHENAGKVLDIVRNRAKVGGGGGGRTRDAAGRFVKG